MTIYIFGSGGLAREIATYIDQTSIINSSLGMRPRYRFVDDSCGCEDCVTEEEYEKIKNPSTIIGIGNCEIRARVAQKIRGPFTFINEKASIERTADIGEGCVIAPGAVVSNKAIIGEHCLLNYNCTIGHDTHIGDYSIVSPNASVGGTCVLGQRVYIGSGAQIKEKLEIGEGSIIGMGAVVTKNIPPNCVVVGNPGRFYDKEYWNREKGHLFDQSSHFNAR